MVEFSSATFSEDGGSSRDGRFECHLCSWNLPSLKIAWAAFLDHSCYTSNQVVNMEAPFNFFDFVWEVLLKVSQVLIYNSSKMEW